MILEDVLSESSAPQGLITAVWNLAIWQEAEVHGLLI